MLHPALPWVEKLRKECDLNSKMGKVKKEKRKSILYFSVKNTGKTRIGVN